MSRAIPKNFPVRPLTAAAMHTAKDMMTCGECGRSWDDAIPTSYTPSPSARCPFEYFHEAPKPERKPAPVKFLPSNVEWSMGRDQYNRDYHNLGKHPRKALMERLGRKHVSKMYVDSKSGGPPKHVGYVIGGLWITLYRVMPWERRA